MCPRFSVVIPVFDRATELLRAVASCHVEHNADVEIVIVDDGSTTPVTDILREHSRPNALIVRHDVNRGVCAARNTGVRAASGEWILFLDSDDEYLPNAFAVFRAAIDTLPPDIHRIGFMYALAGGGLSPHPTPNADPLDYTGYIKWASTACPSDFHNCIRRDTFAFVQLPEDRNYETTYHLDFAQRYNTMLVPYVVAIVHEDAPNRYRRLDVSVRVKRALAEASDRANGYARLLANHGETVKRVDPKRWRMWHRNQATFNFIAGNVNLGFKQICRCIVNEPTSVTSWLILVTGIVDRRLIAWTQALRS